MGLIRSIRDVDAYLNGEDAPSGEDLAAMKDIEGGGTGELAESPAKEPSITHRAVLLVGRDASYRLVVAVAKALADAEERGASKAADVRLDVARLQLRAEAAELDLAKERETSRRALVEAADLRREVDQRREEAIRMRSDLEALNANVVRLTGDRNEAREELVRLRAFASSTIVAPLGNGG